ncbi:transcription factor with AP2 domain(s), putative (ApiAP2), partial [Plasmodium malariae]
MDKKKNDESSIMSSECTDKNDMNEKGKIIRNGSALNEYNICNSSAMILESEDKRKIAIGKRTQTIQKNNVYYLYDRQKKEGEREGGNLRNGNSSEGTKENSVDNNGATDRRQMRNDTNTNRSCSSSYNDNGSNNSNDSISSSGSISGNDGNSANGSNNSTNGIDYLNSSEMLKPNANYVSNIFLLDENRNRSNDLVNAANHNKEDINVINEKENYETLKLLEQETNDANNPYILDNTIRLDHMEKVKETSGVEFPETEQSNHNMNNKINNDKTYNNTCSIKSSTNFNTQNSINSTFVTNDLNHLYSRESTLKDYIINKGGNNTEVESEDGNEEFFKKKKSEKGIHKNNDVDVTEDSISNVESDNNMVNDENLKNDNNIVCDNSVIRGNDVVCGGTIRLKKDKGDEDIKREENNVNEKMLERKNSIFYMLKGTNTFSNIKKKFKKELKRHRELNNITEKRVYAEIFLQNQINCYDLLLEIRKKVPIWGEYESNFFFHWRKIMALSIEELKIYILIFRSLSIETIKHLNFLMLKIIIEELDELRKVHEPFYKPFIFTHNCMKYSDYTYEKSSDIYVNMNEFIQPWYMKNFNKSMDIKKFLSSLDILENQKQKSYIIQAMEIPSHIVSMCDTLCSEHNGEAINRDYNTTASSKGSKGNETNTGNVTNNADRTNTGNETNTIPKKVKKICGKKKENYKIKNLNTSINSRPKKRTGYYDLEIDGVVASFEARKGVYYDKSRKLWRANWKENGKIQTKGFSVNGKKEKKYIRTLDKAQCNKTKQRQ